MNTMTFAQDVLRGLASTPKRLPSKYFYDDEGSRIFQEIMGLDEYYLTGCEMEIMRHQAAAILQHCRTHDDEPFEVLEFGAGDGAKTKVLLKHFLEANAQFTYVPIDISRAAIDHLADTLTQEIEALDVHPFHAEYVEGLARLNSASSTRKIVLFLGSNIGNFTDDEACAFLWAIRSNLRSGDKLLVGFDLKKDPRVILRAYNDEQGVTARFNLNLLKRINNELDGNFDLASFVHAPLYDVVSGEARSYLVSTKRQTVSIADTAVTFDEWETIHTEISRKYSICSIEAMARRTGFVVEHNFTDSRHYFVDSLWNV